MNYLLTTFILVIFPFFNGIAADTCKQECFTQIDNMCSQCFLDGNQTTPRTYIERLKDIILNEKLPAVVSSPESKEILKRAKSNLFKKWGINPKKPLQNNLKVPTKIFFERKDGTLDISMNSQLAHELLKISNGDENIETLATIFLKYSTAGNRIDKNFRRAFEKNFDALKGDSKTHYSICYQTKDKIHAADYIRCKQAKEKTDKEYFDNRLLDYVTSIDQWNPRIQNSPSHDSSLFISEKDEGLTVGGDYLFQCHKSTSGITRSSGDICEDDSLSAFSEQMKEIEDFKSSPHRKYFDLLRIEAIRQLMLNYTNATGELPPRGSISQCDQPYGYSLNNIYENSASHFNPQVSAQDLDPKVIGHRNKSVIQRLIVLSQKAKALYEVKHETCVYDEIVDQCYKTQEWERNEPHYNKIDLQIKAILNEFPLLASKTQEGGNKYFQVLNKSGPIQALLKLSDEEIFRQRDKVIKRNLIDSINRFCEKGDKGINDEQLMKMSGLRSSAISNFPHLNLNSLDICLAQYFKRKEEREQKEQTVYMIGCAGVSAAAGLFSWYAGGSGAIATAIGLGCFSVETSTIYDQFIQAGIEEENIHACFISAPDLDENQTRKLCTSSNWQEAKQRYEDAATNLLLQAALSPLEIFPVISDLRALKSSRKEIQALLETRDQLIDLGNQAKLSDDVTGALELEQEIARVESRLTDAGVTSDDLKTFYQNKAINGDEATTRPDLSDATTRPDPSDAITQTDPTEAITRPDPSDAITQTDPTEAITRPDPSDAITQADPTEAITQPDLTEAITPTDPKLRISDVDPDKIATATDPTLMATKAAPDQIRSVSRSRVRPSVALTKGELQHKIRQNLRGLIYQELENLKRLPQRVLSNIDYLISLGPEYQKFAHKLLKSNYSHIHGLASLSPREVEEISRRAIEFVKRDKTYGEKFLKFFAGDEMSLVGLDDFLKNCSAKRNCGISMELLEERMKRADFSADEKLLLQRSPGAYMDFYIPMSQKEPLGQFIGQGGFGAVFCRGNSPNCEEIIKIPLHHWSQAVYDSERTLADLYIKHGNRAAQITSSKRNPVMIKTFIPGKEASDYIVGGVRYTQNQQDDLVEFFKDMKMARDENPLVRMADIKANNIKWDPTQEKWIFVDTGVMARSRDMFSDVNDFYDTWGREFFFPPWISQSKDELAKSKAMWKQVCAKLIAQLDQSKQAILAPACAKSP